MHKDLGFTWPSITSTQMPFPVREELIARKMEPQSRSTFWPGNLSSEKRGENPLRTKQCPQARKSLKKGVHTQLWGPCLCLGHFWIIKNEWSALLSVHSAAGYWAERSFHHGNYCARAESGSERISGVERRVEEGPAVPCDVPWSADPTRVLTKWLLSLLDLLTQHVFKWNGWRKERPSHVTEAGQKAFEGQGTQRNHFSRERKWNSSQDLVDLMVLSILKWIWRC